MLFLSEVNIQDILSTPAVVAGLFAVVGIFLAQLWDLVKENRREFRAGEKSTNAKLEAALLGDRLLFATEQKDFREEMREERDTILEEVKALRSEISLLRAENVQLRAENLEYRQRETAAMQRIQTLQDEVVSLVTHLDSCPVK